VEYRCPLSVSVALQKYVHFVWIENELVDGFGEERAGGWEQVGIIGVQVGKDAHRVDMDEVACVQIDALILVVEVAVPFLRREGGHSLEEGEAA